MNLEAAHLHRSRRPVLVLAGVHRLVLPGAVDDHAGVRHDITRCATIAAMVRPAEPGEDEGGEGACWAHLLDDDGHLYAADHPAPTEAGDRAGGERDDKGA